MAPPKKGVSPRRLFSLAPDDLRRLAELRVKLDAPSEAFVVRKALRALAKANGVD